MSSTAALSGLERGFVAIISSLTATSLAAVVLADTGHFGLFPIAAVLAFGCGALALARSFALRRSAIPAGGATTPPADNSLVGAISVGVLTIAALMSFTPPFETALWAGDATVNLGYGAQIARHGSFAFTDAFVAEVPPGDRLELFDNPSADDMTGDHVRFPGGVAIADIEEGIVAAGFSPLFPIWVALFAAALGPSLAIWVGPFFGVAGIISLFFLARRFGGNAAGFVAAALLAASMPQVWFSRLPSAETLAQFFVLSGLWLAIHASRSGSPTLAFASGVVMGTAGLARLDVLATTIVGVAVFAAVSLTSRLKEDGTDPSRAATTYPLGAFIGGLASSALIAASHLALYPSNYRIFFARRLGRLPYGDRVSDGLSSLGAFPTLLLIIGAAAITCLAWILAARRVVPDNGVRRRSLGWLLTAGLGLYGIAYIATNRPRLIETADWLAAYLSWPLLAVAVVGAAEIVRSRIVVSRHRPTRALLIAFAAVSLHYLYNPQLQDVGIHMGTMRRFVPVVIPGILALAASGLVRIPVASPPAVRRAITATTFLVLLALVAAPTRTLRGEPLWSTVTQQRDSLAAGFPEDAVVLVAPELAGTHVQTALTYSHPLDGLVLRHQYPDRGLVERQVLAWLDAGRQVFLLSGAADLHFYAPRLSMVEVSTHRLAVRTLTDSQSAPPRELERREANFTTYRLDREPDGKTTIDVGSYASDALAVFEGLHAPEREPGPDPSFRWTGKRASMEVPAGTTLALVLGSGRPVGLPQAVVTVTVDGQTIVNRLTVPNAPTPISLRRTAEGSSAKITIESSTFNPKREGLSEDDRDLGVRLYRVELGR